MERSTEYTETKHARGSSLEGNIIHLRPSTYFARPGDQQLPTLPTHASHYAPTRDTRYPWRSNRGFFVQAATKILPCHHPATSRPFPPPQATGRPPAGWPHTTRHPCCCPACLKSSPRLCLLVSASSSPSAVGSAAGQKDRTARLARFSLGLHVRPQACEVYCLHGPILVSPVSTPCSPGN